MNTSPAVAILLFVKGISCSLLGRLARQACRPLPSERHRSRPNTLTASGLFRQSLSFALGRSTERTEGSLRMISSLVFDRRGREIVPCCGQTVRIGGLGSASETRSHAFTALRVFP